MIIEKSKMSSPGSGTASNSCPRFVRNAWKKDLCSNCFKPKEEHAEPPKVEINTKLTWSLNELPPLPSILKTALSKVCKGSGVTFNSEESEVIGYGGNDEFSDDDDDDDFFDENPKYEGEDLPDSEYEKELQKLTKTNTDFNSITENLNKEPSENIQPITPLKLGRPDLNEGKTKSVLVTVQPFGNNTPAKVNNAPKVFPSNGVSKKETTETDGRSHVQSKMTSSIPKPTSEHVSKTSVNGETSDAKPSLSSDTQSLLNKSDSQNKIAQLANVNIVTSNSSERSSTSPPKLLSWKTLADQKTEMDSKKTETDEKKISDPVVKSTEVEQELSSDERESHQVRRTCSGTSTESRSRKCLQRGNVITKSHEIVKSKIVQQNKSLDDTLDSLVDATELAEHDNHVTNINIETQVNDKTFNKNTFLKKELCEKINNVISKNHKSKLEFMKQEMSEPELNEWVTVESACRTEDIAPESPQDSSLEDNMFEREKIGEPDGKADSDSSEHSEPPALPKIPPPYEDTPESNIIISHNHAPPARSSFLHNKKVASNDNLELKPKIGIKPNGLLFSIPQQFSSPTTKLNGFLNSNNKDIKINSLKIQSNYVENKRKSGDYDTVNFHQNEPNSSDTIRKLSTSSDESQRIYKQSDSSSTSSSPETYKFLAEQDTMFYNKSKTDTMGDRNNTPLKSNQNKTVESELNDMIDSKIIFDKEYENVVKSTSNSRLQPVEFNAIDSRRSSEEQTYANFNDAIDRLNGLEEKFNPIYNYSRSRSNSYDENFADSVSTRCETPSERTKRQAPLPPPTPPLHSGCKKTPSKPPLIYPKPDLDMVTPPPRKSSSTDCLAEKYSQEKFSSSDKLSKKIGSSTAATRMRHTLKKFLRLGKEDVDFSTVTSPAPRPRPKIIHPIDYNKPGVEVLKSGSTSVSNKENEHESSNGVSNVNPSSTKARPSKPPPPPRSHSLTDVANNDCQVYENVSLKPASSPATNSLLDASASPTTTFSPTLASTTTFSSPNTSLLSSSPLNQDLSLPLLSSDSPSPSTPHNKPARPPPPKSAEYLKRQQAQCASPPGGPTGDLGSHMLDLVYV
uniref:Uncharacterized protein n=1 Tax=Cacopsylla melanoneura TaxID=428564 RepID=A0A8D8V434_9HEMI